MNHFNGNGNSNGNSTNGNGFSNGNGVQLNGGGYSNGNGNGVKISNGSNGLKDSGANGSAFSNCWQKGIWTIGLVNSGFRYLTAESFGHKINANGGSLKKKQTWSLEPAEDGNAICLRSHLNRYLAVDQFGNVTCDSDEREPGAYFEISIRKEAGGLWALKNIVRGYYLGAASDKLVCTAKAPGLNESWSIHLAARPQVTIKSIGRKRYARLAEAGDEIHVDANVPWGSDTLFTLDFREGFYALHTSNNKYLHRDGKLQENCEKDSLYSIEYHHGQLALRDNRGLYLASIGSKAILKTRSHTVTKDELFMLEDSLPQASFMAAFNSRYVSVKQGVDVTANQDEISNHEMFQLEFESATKRWYIRTMQDKYWTLETSGGIQACAEKKSSNSLFDLIWQNDGSVAFRANNGKFIYAKRSGHLYANCESPDENSKFYFYIMNRPILVLKCEQGYVGFKANSFPRLECNKATYETIIVERDERYVYFKGQNGMYWTVLGDEIAVESEIPIPFTIELREPTKICIKTAQGIYVNAEKNGGFRISDENGEKATKWEF